MELVITLRYAAELMTRLLRLLLLLGALLGLFAQQGALATAAHAAAPVALSQMSDDCMQMMQAQQQQPAKKPCKGSLDCMASMGCIAPIVLGFPPVPAVDPLPAAKLTYWSLTSVLVGTEPLPEPQPPTILG